VRYFLAFFRKTHTCSIAFWGNSKIRSACFYLVRWLSCSLVG